MAALHLLACCDGQRRLQMIWVYPNQSVAVEQPQGLRQRALNEHHRRLGTQSAAMQPDDGARLIRRRSQHHSIHEIGVFGQNHQLELDGVVPQAPVSVRLAPRSRA